MIFSSSASYALMSSSCCLILTALGLVEGKRAISISNDIGVGAGIGREVVCYEVTVGFIATWDAVKPHDRI